jgi:hypothetical protein
MSLTGGDDFPAIATTVPSPVELRPNAGNAGGRDLLATLCFYFHFAVMLFILAGWAIPFGPAILFYLAFIPAVAVQWQFNKNSCVLNNIESLMRYGTWRAEQNAEEGAWLMTLIRNLTGIQLKPWQVDLITYGIMASLWGAGLSHLLWW